MLIILLTIIIVNSLNKSLLLTVTLPVKKASFPLWQGISPVYGCFATFNSLPIHVCYLYMFTINVFATYTLSLPGTILAIQMGKKETHTCQVSRFERDAHEFERLSRPHDRILKNTHNSGISRIITIFVFLPV